MIVSEEGILMTSKERVMTAVALSGPDWVPMYFNANPVTMKRLMEDLGVPSLRELLLQLHKVRNLDGGVREYYWGIRCL